MPRKRNEETEARIHAAARTIILEEGFDACSYTALAKATGIARTTIQHYAPRKEMFATQLMQDIADLAYAQAATMLPEDAHPLAMSYLAGQVSHSIYYSTDGLKRFLLDVSTDRRLQYQIPPSFDNLALGYVGSSFEKVGPQYQDLLIQSMGGIYDVHFVCIREGRFPETQLINEAVLRTYARVLHIDQKEVDNIVERYRIETNELLKIGRRLAKKL